MMSQENRNAEGHRPPDDASPVQPDGPQERQQGQQERQEQSRAGQQDGGRQRRREGQPEEQGPEDEVKNGEAGARTAISGIDGR
jgi:hypothetical protein